MLKPSECFAGPISDAKTTSLILPRTQYEHRSLIVVADGKKHAVCLDGIDREMFMAFECESNEHWNGVHVPGIEFELDETSLTNIDGFFPPLGSMVRSDDKLFIHVRPDGQTMGRGGTRLPILSGLPKCAERSDACFTRWQIVLGEGEAKQELHLVDVSKSASAR